MRSFVLGSTIALALVLVGPMLGAAAAGVTTDTTAHALPGLSPWHLTFSQSTNWAGFVAKSTKKTVTDVKGSWVVPKVQGTCPSSLQAASFWVGIDGFSSGTVEQTGTDTDCSNGHPHYYAWYEFYPRPSHNIGALTITPGDVISAEVSFNTGTFTTTIKDVTTGHSSSATSTIKAQRNSAEWIVEAPYLAGTLPLTNFGSIGFGYDNTSVNGTDYATISAVSGAMGSFSGLNSITMVNNAGTANKAVPSAVSTDKTSFGVTWKSAGP